MLVLAVLYFNRIIGLRNRMRTAWSDVDVLLKRRHDLVPNLVDIVRAYAGHEAETLERAARARAAGGIRALGESESKLAGALRTVFAVAERYPDLKAQESFASLTENLVNIEDDLQYARRYYNAVVRDYNTLIQSFPGILVAPLAGAAAGEHFQLEEEERETPEVTL